MRANATVNSEAANVAGVAPSRRMPARGRLSNGAATTARSVFTPSVSTPGHLNITRMTVPTDPCGSDPLRRGHSTYWPPGPGRDHLDVPADTRSISTMGRVRELDGLRGVAVLLVV